MTKTIPQQEREMFLSTFPTAIDYPPPPKEGHTTVMFEMEVRNRTERAMARDEAIAKYWLSRLAQREAQETERRNRILRALAMMWNQYCGKRGHLYMSAGEEAAEELQKAGLLSDDYSEVDWEKIDALLTPSE